MKRIIQRSISDPLALALLEGTADQMKIRADGMVVTQVRTPQGLTEIAADFVIDCTGLEADISEHRVLADLLELRTRRTGGPWRGAW